MTKVWSDDDKARFTAERDEKLTQMQEQLASGVQHLMATDGWVAWLKIARHFHTYSLNNQLLISVQHPQATQVAGYRAWQASGRQVRRGETGIRILAPITKPATTEDGTPILNQNGKQRRSIVGVKPATVFDISQTDGPSLAQQPSQGRPLQGQAPEGMWDNLHQYATQAGFSVTIGACQAEGMTDFRDRSVTIRDGFEQAHATTVLAHEVGHVTMHNPQDAHEPARDYCRGMIEVEAESFAWLVNDDWGLDSSTDSFAYLAGWTTQAAKQQHKTPTEILTASAERIRGAVARYLTFRHEPGPDHPSAALREQINYSLTHTTPPTTPASRTLRIHAALQSRHRNAAGPTR
ncbi:ArdC-like ssDNA-binding domain-containing protein [Tessaracoccus rhinocerotis]|nr:ArdC-like ssDNA-binding domain-containing protein [Tessaracoccus rhinocerotis]